MAIAEAAAVVSALKSASDIVDKLRSGDTKDDLRNAGAALAELLISARMAALDLIEQKAVLMDERSSLNQRIEMLERENRRLADFDEKSEKYERLQTSTGKFVYREKQSSDSNVSAPYLCPHCVSEKKLSILQGRRDDTYHFCHACKWQAFL